MDMLVYRACKNHIYTTGQKILNIPERLHVAYKYWTVCIIISVLLG